MSRQFGLWIIALGLIAGATALAACSDSESADEHPADFCLLLASVADPFAAEVPPETLATELQQLREVAPEEIRADVDTLLAAVEAVVAEPDPDDAAEALKPQEAALFEASENLAAYALDNCGVDLNR